MATGPTARLSGKTKLAEAIRYALKPMPEARAYLGDGRLELDNNICERSIRPVAPGRKNCLFPGSVGGGEAAAIAYALIETAEMNNVDPEAWLTWVLERIADHRLTPSTNSCRGTGSPKTSKTRPDRTDTHRRTYAVELEAPRPQKRGLTGRIRFRCGSEFLPIDRVHSGLHLAAPPEWRPRSVLRCLSRLPDAR